ncbi:MAG: GNAT family N-acetyltransferase [Candidatus Melainabacteria bacterium]
MTASLQSSAEPGVPVDAMLPADANPFDTPLLQRVWLETMASRFDEAERHGEWLIQRHRVFRDLMTLREARVVGWNSVMDQILTPNRVASFARDIQSRRWDYLRIHCNNRYLAMHDMAALKALGLQPVIAKAPTQYVIDLRQGWDGYWESISHNTRKSFRRKIKRAAELEPTFFYYDLDDATIDAFFEDYFRHHIAHWDEKAGGSYFRIPQEREFIKALVKAMRDAADAGDDSAGRPVLTGMRLKGDVASMSLSVISGDTLYWLLTINTGLFKEHFPGIVNMYLSAQAAAEQSFRFFNMGTGDYFYKVQAANMAIPGQVLLAANPQSLPGRLYVPRLAQRLNALEADKPVPEDMTRWPEVGTPNPLT